MEQVTPSPEDEFEIMERQWYIGAIKLQNATSGSERMVIRDRRMEILDSFIDMGGIEYLAKRATEGLLVVDERAA